jgi:hypothetical protein
MTELAHPEDRAIELLAMGALDDDEDLTAHVSTCDVCAAKLAAEARLELELGELHAFRAGHRHITKPSVIRVYFAPILILAAAAVLLLALRGRHRAPAPELRAEPTAAASTKPADLESVIAHLRPQLKKCLRPTVSTGGAEVLLELTIAGDGTVADVVFVTRKGVNDDVAQCLVTVVRSARFQGTGSTSTVRLPLTLVVNR